MASQGIKTVYADPWNTHMQCEFVMPTWPNYDVCVAACDHQCCCVVLINIVVEVLIATMQQQAPFNYSKSNGSQ
jgi:hypothetical protein